MNKLSVAGIVFLLFLACSPQEDVRRDHENFPTWLQDAKSLARKNRWRRAHKEVIPVYVSESTIQQLTALTHAVTYARKSDKKAIFIYSDDIKPNINTFPDLDIQFIESNTDHHNPRNPTEKKIYITTSLQENLQKRIGDNPYNLYVVDSTFWPDYFKDIFPYAANAKEVHIFEEGATTYQVLKAFKESSWLKEHPDLLAKVKKTYEKLPEESPFSVPGSFQKSKEEGSVGALGQAFIDKGERGYTTLLPILTLNNVRHWLQHPYPLTYHANPPGYLNLRDIFGSFSPGDQEAFLKYFNYNRKIFQLKYWESSPKKNMVIIGPGGIVSLQEVLEWVTLIADRYKDEYDLLYKPHPRLHERDLKYIGDIEGISVFEEIFPFELIDILGVADKYVTGVSTIIYFLNDPETLEHIILFRNNQRGSWVQQTQNLKDIMGLPEEKFVTMQELKAQDSP